MKSTIIKTVISSLNYTLINRLQTLLTDLADRSLERFGVHPTYCSPYVKWLKLLVCVSVYVFDVYNILSGSFKFIYLFKSIYLVR